MKFKHHYRENSSWQWIGDLALILIPVIHTGLASAPISDHAKFWVGFVCDVTLVGFKFWSKERNYTTMNRNRIVRK